MQQGPSRSARRPTNRSGANRSDARLAEERSDRPILDTELGLIDEDGPDDESELVGEAVGERDPFVAPEESAMSVRDEAPGAVDHPDDHSERDDADPNAE